MPSGYTSGSALSDTSTYDDASFSTLGVVTPGSYVWTWGSGADADSFTLDIVSVPAPVIDQGLPVVLAVGGVLLGAKLLERNSKRRSLGTRAVSGRRKAQRLGEKSS